MSMLADDTQRQDTESYIAALLTALQYECNFHSRVALLLAAEAARFPAPFLSHVEHPGAAWNRAEVTIRTFLTAIPASGYDVGILNVYGMNRLERVSRD